MSRALFFACLVASSLTPLVARAQPLMVIDAGHGGTDPGAVGCSLEEAAVVLDVAQRLGVLLEAAGVRVALTRDTDAFVGLSERSAFANARSADGFVSVHSNSNAGTPATGTETFVITGAGARSRELGAAVQAEMLAAWGLRDRLLKEANFAVLRDTSMPAALGEMAFTNNCGTDALLLADPAARQTMAEHLRDAVLAWLGITPTTDGTLQGVVFEDQGVGVEDLTVRLPGASVRIVETGATVNAGAGDASWSFVIPPGEYTVEASIAGHTTATRTCTVTGGSITWCSIGLFPEGASVDAGSGVDASIESDGAVVEVDAGATEPRPAAGGCGCAAAGGGSRGTIGLLLAGLVVLLWGRRRGGRGMALLLAALVVAGCAHDTVTSTSVPLGETQPASVLDAVTVPSLAVLGDRREWLAEGYVAPILSPDGRLVLVASVDQTALFVGDLRTLGGFREVCHEGRCGYEPAWQSDGSIAFRTEGQSGTAVPSAAASLVGDRVPVTVGERGVHAWTDDEDRAWLRIDGRTREVGPPGGRVMMPSLTSDHRHVVMWSLTDGVLVRRVEDDVLVRVGRGGHPRVDPSGRWLVLERTEDDGHAITAADLFVVDLADPAYAVAPLVVGADHLERMPTLSRISADGTGTLAYLEEGALVVRSVRFTR